ncbi:MAG TPA: hydantoinase/oxoprolinase family protein [Gammaproteobacteria bacterium]
MKFLGVDTGGTFTDFVYYDGAALHIHKVLSTPEQPENAILQGIRDLAIDPAEVQLIHGSTVATNALLEGKGVRTAYITNRGLKDLLTIGRQARAGLYDFSPAPVKPPVAAELCFELDARLSAAGEELQPLAAEQLAELAAQLRAQAVEAAAINMLFSFRDSAQERQIAAVLPDELFVSLASEVLPEYREYERGIATWINASLGPLMHRYLGRLKAALKSTPISIMQSTGGTADAASAGRRTVHLLLSGPAGGLAGAREIGRLSHRNRLLTFDMGGTSTDVALIEGEIRLTTEGRIGAYPVAVPMVDMHTIGAGGGSIAWLDPGGLLQVGPESAGANPGPACYGRGGRHFTVTDANLILGRLPAEAALGGNLHLDAGVARRAAATLAGSLDMTIEQVAEGVIRLANEHMAQALRVISVQRGIDVKNHTLVSFGGAGGLHVCALAELMNMRQAMVPVHGGVLSALGMLVAPRQRLLSRTVNESLECLSEAGLNKLFETLVSDGIAELVAEGQDARAITIHRSVDLRYRGQSYTLEIPWHSTGQSADDFHIAHQRTYGHAMDLPVELVNARVKVQAPPPPVTIPALTPLTAQQTTAITPFEFVDVHGVNGKAPCFQRSTLPPGWKFYGPAIVLESVATTLITPDWTVEVDYCGNLLLHKQES